MRINKERLLSSDMPLIGFRGTKAFLVRTVTLLVSIGTYLQKLTKEITFLLVDCSYACNSFIG